MSFCFVCNKSHIGFERCPKCGFNLDKPVFLSSEDVNSWIDEVVWPWRINYWHSLSQFDIDYDNRRIKKYIGTECSIIIPYGIEIIGEYAFYDIERDFEVFLPDSLCLIERNAFSASHVNRVLPSFFEGLSNLEYVGRVELPKSCKKIEFAAFSGCPNLRTIRLNKGLEKIAAGVFAESPNISSIYIPDTLVTIGENAFDFPTYDTEAEAVYSRFEVDCNNVIYGAINGCLIEKQSGKIVRGNLIDGVPNDSNIHEIGPRAFSCGEYHEYFIKIPSNIDTIGKNAFQYCFGMFDISIPKSVLRIEKGAFSMRKLNFRVHCEARAKPDKWDELWCFDDPYVASYIQSSDIISWGEKIDSE